MKFYPILAFGLALPACSGETEVASGEFDDGDGGKGSYSVTEGGGDNQVTIKTEDGEVKFNAGAGSGADTKLPLNLKLYPGADVKSSMTGSGDGKTGGMVSFHTKASQDDVIAFYKDQAETMGIKIEAEMTMGDRKIIAGNKDGDLNLSVTVAKDNGGGNLVTVIGGKDG